MVMFVGMIKRPRVHFYAIEGWQNENERKLATNIGGSFCKVAWNGGPISNVDLIL